MTCKEINIPFQGYYETLYSEIIDEACEVDEYEIAANNGWDSFRDVRSETEFLQENNIDPFDDAHQHDNIDYSAMKEVLNKIYVQEFEELFNDTFDIKISLKYKLVESPREYNFSTDRLFCEISEVDIKTIFDIATSSQGNFSNYLKENFTSYDGFMSYYSNDFNDWLSKDLVDYDHNELGSLIGCMLHSEGDIEAFYETIYQNVFERAICNGNLQLILEA